jgi:transposase
MRQACNLRLRNALFHLARRAVQRDASCARLYATLKAKGHRYGRVLRSLADWLLRRLMAMLRDRTLYDPYHGQHGPSISLG